MTEDLPDAALALDLLEAAVQKIEEGIPPLIAAGIFSAQDTYNLLTPLHVAWCRVSLDSRRLEFPRITKAIEERLRFAAFKTTFLVPTRGLAEILANAAGMSNDEKAALMREYGFPPMIIEDGEEGGKS